MRLTKAQAAFAALAPLKEQPLAPDLARISANARDHGLGWWAKCEFRRPQAANLEPDELQDLDRGKLSPNRTKFFHGVSRADALSKAHDWAKNVLQARAVYELP